MNTRGEFPISIYIFGYRLEEQVVMDVVVVASDGEQPSSLGSLVTKYYAL